MWALCGGLRHLLEQVDVENACCSSVTVPDGNMARSARYWTSRPLPCRAECRSTIGSRSPWSCRKSVRCRTRSARDFMYVSASAPEPPPLGRHHHRLLHQIVFLDHPRHLIGGASSAGRPRNFRWTCWAHRGGNRRLPRHHGRQRSRGFADISLLVSSLYLCIFRNFPNWLSASYCGVRIRVQASHELRVHDFRLRSQNVSGAYLPFQLGVRLLRNASIPSRKSSLI
jgi:hypothetical protein